MSMWNSWQTKQYAAKLRFYELVKESSGNNSTQGVEG